MLTAQQQEVVDIVCNTTNDKIVAVNAVAGSGKTSTCKAVIDAFRPSNGFYTAFNKAIVMDSSKKFGKLLDCRTIHSLAYRYVKITRPIEDLTYSTIKENISYDKKLTIINELDNFFRSSYIDVYDYAEDNLEDSVLQTLLCDYASKMVEGEINPTFNFLLKCLHILLYTKQLELEYDLMILDECQDTTAVSLEIFKLIHAKSKLILGDKYQNIYSFMNTVNAFELLDDTINLRLTKSFRCNTDIANIVDEYGNSYLDNTFSYVGNEDLEDTHTSIAYLTRTNAALIDQMYNLLNNGITFTITRNIDEIFALPIALLNASSGKPVYATKYKYLEKEYQKFRSNQQYPNFFLHLQNVVKDDVLNHMIKTLSTFYVKGINIYTLKNKVKNMVMNPNIVLTTAHAYKGLEADKVYICNDLNTSVNRSIKKLMEYADSTCSIPSKCRCILNKNEIEDLNTYYVALSRARTSIENVDYMR